MNEKPQAHTRSQLRFVGTNPSWGGESLLFCSPLTAPHAAGELYSRRVNEVSQPEPGSLVVSPQGSWGLGSDARVTGPGWARAKTGPSDPS